MNGTLKGMIPRIQMHLILVLSLYSPVDNTPAVHGNRKQHRVPSSDRASQGWHILCPLHTDEDTGTWMRGNSPSLSQSGHSQDLESGPEVFLLCLTPTSTPAGV